MPSPPADPVERRRIAAEIVVVIALGVLPHMLGVLYGWASEPRSPTASTVAYSLYGVGRNVTIVLPLLWIMYRSGRGWPYFGVERFLPWADTAIGILVVVVISVAHYCTTLALYIVAYVAPWARNAMGLVGENAAAMAGMRAPIAGTKAWAALALYMMSNGIGEELVLRGYLLPRIRELTGRTGLSILFVSAVAASYHLYQGSYAAMVIFVGQIALCWMYVKVPRVAAFAIGHGLYDFLISVWWTNAAR